MIRLLLDQGLPRSTAALLTDAGWDVIHVGDIAMSSAPDEQVIKYAQQDNRVCVTLDADFHALLALSNTKAPSVIRIRQEGLNGAELADLLKTIWHQIEHAVGQGAIVSVTRHTLRIRRLPILDTSTSGN